MLLRYAGVLVAVLLVLPAPGGASGQPDPAKVVVAEVNGEPITLADFNLSYEIKFRADATNAPFDWREDHLERVVDRMILATEARARGLTFRMSEDEITRYKRKMLVQEYYRVYGRPDTIDIREETIRREYDAGNFAYRIFSIMVPTREEANDILALVRQGEDFEALSRERGTGVETGTGGDLGWKTWRELELVPEIREAALRMEVGQVSGVLASDYGFHIIKIMGKRPNPQPPYSQMWKDIFANLRRGRVTAHMTAFRNAFEERQNIVLDQDAVALLAEKVEEAEGRGTSDALEPLLTRREMTERLVSFNGRHWTIGEFLDYCRAVEQRVPGAFDGVSRFVRQQVVNNLLVEEAQRLGLEDSPGLRERMRTLEEVSLESDFRGMEVEGKLRITPAMAEAYYTEHMSEFWSPEEVQLRMIVVETRTAADSVLEALGDGADFAELARVRSLHGSSGEQGGSIGYIHRGRLGGLLDDVAFDLEIGERSEPFPYMGYWGVVEATDKRAPRQLSLEEVNTQIVRILEPVERDRLSSSLLGDLRKKYNVVVYTDRLR